nr:type I restriction enzyme HsdR N-terminal domain-containing protein [Ferruginivarius sediminum]
MIGDQSGTARPIAPGWTGAPKSARNDVESGGSGLPDLSSRPTSRKAEHSKAEIAWRFDISARNLGARKAYGKCRFTNGRIIVRGKLVSRGRPKRADYVLYYKPNIPIALIEAKDNTHSVGDGMQQALEYAETLKVPSNDRGGASTPRHCMGEREYAW